MSNNNAYTQLIEESKQRSLLESCSSVLAWDEQTYLPTGGAELRANQLSMLAGMIHERATSSRIGDLLEELSDQTEGDSPEAVNVRELKRAYDRATRLPRSLVENLSRTSTLSQRAWIEARQTSDFSIFRPWLKKVVELKREEAAAVGFGDGIPYDALLDEYEPGTSASEIQNVFSPLRDELVSLVAAIRDSPHQPDESLLTRHYPRDAQREFGLAAAKQIGFDFQRGRLDVAAHPFCSGFGPGDCRLTTRYDEHHFPGAFFGTLHESGHGMYEQGLLPDAFGTPMGESTSLGIHESQSRLWENFVGRSRAFWDHFYSRAQAAFGETLSGVELDDFYRSINSVRPSFIRVEADEVTYNLHIMLRFELEQPLISGDLQPEDLPSVWNSRFEEFFGITPESDSAGCLQDIHWSCGLIGYFPTYALGNMYAAQFYNAASRELGDLDTMFRAGDFLPLRNWLNTNIHARGRQYRAARLVEVVTGETLSYSPLVEHLRAKYGEIYQL